METSKVLLNYETPNIQDIQDKANDFENTCGMNGGEKFLYTTGYQDGYLKCLEDLQNGLVVPKPIELAPNNF
jgi:hypothetical protein